MFLISVILVLLLPLTYSAPTAFKHPGVLVSKTQLDFIKSQVSSQKDPIYTAYKKAIASPYGSKTYKIQGVPSGGIIDCGSYSHPDIGCSASDSDGAAAFLQSILWYITGDMTYANNAKEILNTYVKNLKGYNNSNTPLQAGWNCQKWPATAEILRYSNSGWTDEDTAGFTGMVMDIVLPHIYPGSGANGNWELTMIDAMLGIAVFTDNTTLYDHAIEFWNQRVPAYFYYHTDGDKPVPPPRGKPSWYGQHVFNSTVDGVCQETCRDFGHTSYGIAGTTHAAETAWIQGNSLYENQKLRLAAALEFTAGYQLAGSDKVPDYVCNGTVHLGTGPTFVIGYNQLHNRLGIDLPKTEQLITTRIDTESDPVDNHLMVFETLTHGSNAPSEI
jgi:hypothetical protein